MPVLANSKTKFAMTDNLLKPIMTVLMKDCYMEKVSSLWKTIAGLLSMSKTNSRTQRFGTVRTRKIKYYNERPAIERRKEEISLQREVMGFCVGARTQRPLEMNDLDWVSMGKQEAEVLEVWATDQMGIEQDGTGCPHVL